MSMRAVRHGASEAEKFRGQGDIPRPLVAVPKKPVKLLASESHGSYTGVLQLSEVY